MVHYCHSIPGNFFWDKGVRFLSWGCGDFWRRHDHFRRFPKKSEVFRRRPKVETAFTFPSPSLRTRINASSLPVLFTSKIRDREKGILIYSFYTWFRSLHQSELTYFWKLCRARRQNLTFFRQAWEIGSQAWDRSFQPAGVRVTPKAWELAGIP